MPCALSSPMRAAVFFSTKVLYAPQSPRSAVTMRMATFLTFSGTRSMGSSASRPLPLSFLTRPLIMPVSSSLKGLDLVTPDLGRRHQTHGICQLACLLHGDNPLLHGFV